MLLDPLAMLCREHPSDEPDEQIVGLELDGDRLTLRFDDGRTVECDTAELASRITGMSFSSVRAA